MQPFIHFNLDAMKRVGPAARLAQVTPADVGWGLVQLWAWCWDEKLSIVNALQLEAFFGGDGARIGASLAAFRFLEPLDGGEWRVRGVDTYLRIDQHQIEAGKARAANSRRDPAGRLLSGTSSRVVQPAGPAVQPESSRHPGLSPTTEHRTPNIEKKKQPPPPPTSSSSFAALTPEPPGEPSSAVVVVVRDLGSGDRVEVGPPGFWDHLQDLRAEAGLVRESIPPPGYVAWFRRAGGECPTTLDNAFVKFLDDQAFASRRWPVGLFMQDGIWTLRV